VSTCEFSKTINKPESPKDQTKQMNINPKFPNEITVTISELTKESPSNDESVTSQTPIQEDLKSEVVDLEVASEVTPKVTSEINPEVTPRVTSEINPKVTPEVTSEINPEANPETNLEVTPEVNLEVTSLKEELPLINLDEDDNTGLQPVQPKISNDILSLDWEGYQKSVMEEEVRLTMERQPIQTFNPRKLDTGLKDFDSLFLN